MRDQNQNRRRFINVATYRARQVAEKARNRMRKEQTARFTLAVLVWLAATPSASQAGARQSSATPTPLDLQITQVSRLAAIKPSADADIEIRWTAKVPQLTTIGGFDVLLEVRYSDGSRGAARNETLKATARSAILSVAAHSKSNSAAGLKEFHASIKAHFKVASTLTITQQVTPASGGSARTGSSSANQPEVFVTDARLAQGCAANQECVDVRWRAVAPRAIAIEGFTVLVDALSKNGAHRTGQKAASAADRQARLALESTGSEITLINVTLIAGFSSLDSRTVIRDGVF